MYCLSSTSFTGKVHRAASTRFMRYSGRALPAQSLSPWGRALRVNRVLCTQSAVVTPDTAASGMDDKPETVVNGSVDHPQFQWTKHWWPVAVANSLDQSKPHALTLIGQDYVLWWDKAASSWRVMQDRCPHRLGRLSLGRIASNGQLMCSWHGWTFDGKGSCTNIPQVSDPRALSAACSSKRTCATTFPVYEAQGLIFAWLESGPEAEAEAAAQKPLLPESPPGTPPPKWDFHFDQHMDFARWMEQPMDPAHAPFLHTRLLTEDTNIPMPADRVPSAAVDLLHGFEWKHGSYSSDFKNMTVVRKLHPPNLVRVDYENGALKSSWLYATPIRPGMHRVFTYNQGLVGTIDNLKPNWLERQWTEWQCKNLAHGPLVSMLLSVEDSVINAVQYSDMQLNGMSSRDYRHFSPADQGVQAATRWLDLAGYQNLWKRRLPPGVVDRMPVVTPESPHLFNIYEGHTKGCVKCQKTMRELQTIAKTAFYASFALAFLSLLCASTGAGWVPTALLALAAAASWVGHLRVLKFGHRMFVDNKSHWKEVGEYSLVPSVPQDIFSRFTP